MYPLPCHTSAVHLPTTHNSLSTLSSPSPRYETANGIKAEARGAPSAAGPEGPAVAVQGSFSYVADDGQTYTVTYVADENGFQPQGAHLPVSPPIPEAILRSLEFNAKYYKGEDEQQQPLRAAKPTFGRAN